MKKNDWLGARSGVSNTAGRVVAGPLMMSVDAFVEERGVAGFVTDFGGVETGLVTALGVRGSYF